jgi:hypothetical protein
MRLALGMWPARRIVIPAVVALAALLVLAGPVVADKKKLHDGTVLSCSIEHNEGIALDILNLRIAEAQADKQAVSQAGKNGTAIEVAVALLYLANSGTPHAVVDGFDKGNLSKKKGVGNFDMSFNSFGTYQVNITWRAKGFKPATDSFKFQVTDTNGGACHMVP